MSRNAKKIEKEENSNNSRPTNNDNPFGLSFVIPTEMVVLPSSGEYYPSTSPLHGVQEVEIRHMTAKEEDILSTSGMNTDQLFNRLLNSLLCSDEYKAEDFLEDDKMAILLSARVTGYGPKYSTPTTCAHCNSPFIAEFDLTIRETEPPAAGKYDPETDSFDYELPVTGIKLKVINFKEQDEENIQNEKKRREKINFDFSYSETFLKTVILSANEITDRKLIDQLISVMPAGDVKSLKSFYRSCQPRMSTRQEVKCTVCNGANEREVPLSWAFFRTEF